MNLANSEAVHPCKDINGMIPLRNHFARSIVHIQLPMQMAMSGIKLLQWISEGMRFLLLAR